jgi:glycosyltransferase involved in cell wall biosynthesis
MRILEVNKYYYDRRGAERYMLQVERELTKLGHEVIPFAMHHPESIESKWSKYFVSELKTESLNPLAIPKYFARSLWSFEAARRMRELIKEAKPDVAHLHNIYTHLSPSILRPLKRAGIPVVMTVHDYGTVCGNYALWDPVKSVPLNIDEFSLIRIAETRFIKNSALATFMQAAIAGLHRRLGSYHRFIDQYIAVSHFVKDALVARGVPAAKIKVMKNIAGKGRKRAGAGEGIFYFGALDAMKGVSTLIEAMHAFPEVELRIAGDGPQREELKELARGARVTFLGHISKEQVEEELARARAAVFPSLWHEPGSIGLVEALRAGTPCIVSDRGGLPELVDYGRAGLIFEAGNARSLEHALARIIQDEPEAEHIGAAGKSYADAFADPAHHTKRLVELHESL